MFLYVPTVKFMAHQIGLWWYPDFGLLWECVCVVVSLSKVLSHSSVYVCFCLCLCLYVWGIYESQERTLYPMELQAVVCHPS